MASHVLQTVRRILKTRKPAQQRYQDGDIKLEMRFQVQGFDRVLVRVPRPRRRRHVQRFGPVSRRPAA